jgi:V8-like Glu-specific endopeptidase
MGFASHRNYGHFAEAVAQPVAARQPMRVVANTAAGPYRCICRIEARSFDKPGVSIGTGFLVSPFHILTCAHNIYPLQAPKTKSITVFPAQDGQNSKAGIASNGWAISPGWRPKDCTSAGEDYGIIRLSRPVRGAFLRLRQFDPAQLTGSAVRLAGYPTTAADPMAQVMFESAGLITGAIQNVVCGVDATGHETMSGRIMPTISQTTPIFAHGLGSEHGVSGGPVWINDGDALTVVGIHERNIGNGSQGAGILLNDRVLQSVTRWLASTLSALAQAGSATTQAAAPGYAESSPITPQQSPGAANCAGWISDRDSFCKRVADHYLRSEYPGLKRGALKIWHSPNKILSVVDYPDGVAVGVSFFSMPNFVIVRRHFHPTGPRCEYDFDCLPSGDIVFTKRKCAAS